MWSRGKGQGILSTVHSTEGTYVDYNRIAEMMAVSASLFCIVELKGQSPLAQLMLLLV